MTLSERTSGINYLASPYTHPDAAVRQARYDEICRIAAEMMNSGEIVYCPIAATHAIAVAHGLPGDWKYWEKSCMEFVGVSHRVVVAMMPGWRESVGVQAEIALATSLDIPVDYLTV